MNIHHQNKMKRSVHSIILQTCRHLGFISPNQSNKIILLLKHYIKFSYDFNDFSLLMWTLMGAFIAS